MFDNFIVLVKFRIKGMMNSLKKWCVKLLPGYISYTGKQRSFFTGLIALGLVATLMLSLVPAYAQGLVNLAVSLPVNLPVISLSNSVVQQPLLAKNPVQQELRGVWLTNVDSQVLFGRRRLNASLNRLKQFNFNVIYPTVYNWGYTLYPSKVAKEVIGLSVDPTPGLRRRDMLKEVVELGHRKGLRVIPWVEFGFMAPADSQLAKRHPEWVTSRSDGSKIWKEGIHDRVWLSPFRPDVQNYMKDLIVEVVKNYDIDGVQVDDHFGLPGELGYDEYTVALYKKEHSGKTPPTDTKDPEWVKWRADKITDFMKQLFFAVKEVKQGCIMSVSPNPQRFSYEFFLADWARWERMGLIEELIIQLYRDDMKVFVDELERPEVKTARSHIPVSIGVLTGLRRRYVPMEQVKQQVEAVRDRNFAGVSFFFYETLWNMTKEKPRQRQRGFLNLFSTPVKAPILSEGWKPQV